VDQAALSKLLQAVARGETAPDAALSALAQLPFEDLGFARVDHHRALRQGVPEVIYGPGKTPEQIVAIAQAIAARGQTMLATRVSDQQAAALLAHVPQSTHHVAARSVSKLGSDHSPLPGRVAVVTAGTSDLPVAEEAAVTLACCGVQCERITDVGVAGLHRLLASLPRLESVDVVVVVAGMEGALPSVVGGLIGAPLVAVPTSVGYGAALGGFTALAGMLTSCASGVTVVNIDNGFGAALAAVRILRAMQRGSQ
jgi:pyridinium-3,5-biscarboxylic acid mononucleotide synthase